MRRLPCPLERFKNKTEIKAVHPPPTAIHGDAVCTRYGRAILQAGL
jgi:hypothetical protein